MMTKPLTDQPLRSLLNAFASPDPTPGGGSASALASSVGASLLVMVASLPKTRNNTDEERAALAAASAALATIRAALTDAIDADTAAYDAVVAAYRLPKTTDAEKQTRQAAVQRALKGATDVPLGVMRRSADALRHATAIATYGFPAAASDVGVARALLGAGLAGARLNVEINLGSIRDESYAAAVRAEVERLTSANPGA